MLHTEIYPDRRTFLPFTKNSYLVFLGEKEAKYTPPGAEDNEQEPVDGFSYTGTREDGSTEIMATEASYAAFTAGLIRLKYSADAVEAIEANWRQAIKNPDGENAARYLREEEELEQYRNECKEEAKRLLGL